VHHFYTWNTDWKVITVLVTWQEYGLPQLSMEVSVLIHKDRKDSVLIFSVQNASSSNPKFRAIFGSGVIFNTLFSAEILTCSTGKLSRLGFGLRRPP
jgi:hypothetical protein